MTTETDTHWCSWCRDNGYPQTTESNAVISNYIQGASPWPLVQMSSPRDGQKGGYVHVHGLYHVSPSELTIKATLKRSWKRAKRNARNNLSRWLTDAAFKVRGKTWL